MIPGRIMAIDYGTKRVGIAVTDENCIIAGKLGTVMSHLAVNYISDYLKNEKVNCIVIGQPKQKDNTPSDVYNLILNFGKALQKKFPLIPVVLYDERFTSKMAFQAMIDGGLKKSDRRNKSLVDSVSAVILLQSYMEALKNPDFKPSKIN